MTVRCELHGIESQTFLTGQCLVLWIPKREAVTGLSLLDFVRGIDVDFAGQDFGGEIDRLFQRLVRVRAEGLFPKGSTPVTIAVYLDCPIMSSKEYTEYLKQVKAAVFDASGLNHGLSTDTPLVERSDFGSNGVAILHKVPDWVGLELWIEEDLDED